MLVFGLVCMFLSFSLALSCWPLGPLLYTLCILFFINMLLFTNKKKKKNPKEVHRRCSLYFCHFLPTTEPWHADRVSLSEEGNN